jgi:tetratricopeptide (TPR) repeat protein
MKNLWFIPLLFMTVVASANDTSYYAVLRNSLVLADQHYSLTTYQNLANTCDRIIALREKEWLPAYYRAYAYVHMGYMTEDEEKKDELLDSAQASADAALILNPGESEIQLVLALICYGRMEINPMFRATIYFPKANAALERAKELNPRNPRIYYLEGKSTLYKPAFMGGGAEAALHILEKALQYFREFVPPSDIYPRWGEESTLVLYQECRDKIEEE